VFCINLYWHGVFYSSEGVLKEVHTVCTATKGVYDRSACKIINIICVVGSDDHHMLGHKLITTSCTSSPNSVCLHTMIDLLFLSQKTLCKVTVLCLFLKIVALLKVAHFQNNC
jgi:hypothetical protein